MELQRILKSSRAKAIIILAIALSVLFALLANEFNAMWFNPGYREMAPLMVHYLSLEKPWNRFISLDYRAYAWWRKYLSACERVAGYLDRDFIGRVRSNVSRVK